MLTSRSNGGFRSRRSPWSRTRPSVGSSKPAIIRSVVVLPEPDGPSIEKNSPSRTSRSTRSTAANDGVPVAASIVADDALARPRRCRRPSSGPRGGRRGRALGRVVGARCGPGTAVGLGTANRVLGLGPEEATRRGGRDGSSPASRAGDAALCGAPRASVKPTRGLVARSGHGVRPRLRRVRPPIVRACRSRGRLRLAVTLVAACDAGAAPPTPPISPGTVGCAARGQHHRPRLDVPAAGRRRRRRRDGPAPRRQRRPRRPRGGHRRRRRPGRLGDRRGRGRGRARAGTDAAGQRRPVGRRAPDRRRVGPARRHDVDGAGRGAGAAGSSSAATSPATGRRAWSSRSDSCSPAAAP